MKKLQHLLIDFISPQNITQSTKLYSSPALSKKKIDEDKVNHEEVVLTNISIQQLQPEIAKIAQSINEVKVAKPRIDEELPWRITPSPETNKLTKHYLMLSKIRLTCKCTLYYLNILYYYSK
jgi:hypothetical protein